MATARTRNRTAPLTSNAYEDVIECWTKTLHGGVIVCQSPGKAVNLRYRMYRYRTLLCEANGITPYDDMTITLAPRDNRLYVRKRNSGVLEIISDIQPEDLPPLIERDDLIIAPGEPPPPNIENIGERKCRWCKEDIFNPAHHGVGICTHERGRPPLEPTFE